jgi:CO/xanthine dehydrogenase Mo-binding subunit/aerobic-type carbon monoxide dehydrogenase small subunit (CoxS/CutS family)
MAPTSQIVVNGITHELAVEPDRSLLEVLREELGLTGAKPGCGEGVCGACTVLLDDQPVRSCTVRAADAVGHSVGSIEGLAQDGRLDPVQRAFLEVGAFQCGYCTPGMIMATVALLKANADPDDDEVRTGLKGNACRCCTYPRILRAVRMATDPTRATDVSSPVEPAAAGSEPPAPPRRPRRPWDLTTATERDYFDLLPDGLVVVREPGQAHGGRGAGSWSTSTGAWLHVGADGQVTAFSGKVDVGQDNRTALSLRVAEELRVPLSSVRLVMGDTDLCPFDVGTFGSRSMPDAAEHLRRTAASARDCLVGMAAVSWNVSAAGLIAEDGCVREPAGGKRSTAYGELVRGLHRLEVSSADARVTPGPAERLVGHAARRRGALEIVTGARHYPGDIALPGMLHGRVLGPPAFGAVLRSAAVAKAAALPGVTVVQDGSFVGVAAPDARKAARALAAIEADWELMPQPAEAALTAHLRSHPVDEEGWEGTFHHETGDPDTALSSAAVRLAATYTTAYIAHVPLETHVALAAWEGSRLTVWTGTQQPFGVREQLAKALGVPEADVRVVVPDTGGGFGGKHAGEVAQAAARLARASGRPVKVRWSREEEFRRGYLRPAAVIDVRSGAGRDGAIAAWEMRNTNSGMFGLLGPYEIPNQRLDFQPAAAPLAQGSYRALAATANHFARESHIDELAHALELDPLELRLRHLQDDRLAAVLRAVADRIGWGTRSSTGGFGVGLAGGIEKGARIATAVAVRVGQDQHLEVERIVTAFECGAIVHPDGLANQVEGATVMGLGAALFEAIHFGDGAITNASMSEYRVPRTTDVPPIEVILLDRRDLPSTGGGETPIIAIAPALANAIFAATGVRLRALPLVPDGRIPLG